VFFGLEVVKPYGVRGVRGPIAVKFSARSVEQEVTAIG
jgi:hypothetical protein